MTTVLEPYPLYEAVSVVLAPNATAPVVQTNTGSSAIANATVIVTLPNPTTPGNCLIAYVESSQGTTNPVVSGITLGGAAGNWGSARSQNNNADVNSEIWVDWNCAGGQTSVAVSFSGGTGAGGTEIVRVEERSGILASSNPVDQVNGNNGNSAAPASGNTPTLSQPSELLVGAISGGNTVAGPAAPWVNQPVVSQGTASLVTGAQVVNSTAGVGYSGTQTSGVWGAVVVSLKLAPLAVAPGSGTVRISPGQPASPGSGVGASRNSGLLWNVDAVSVSAMPLPGNTSPVSDAQASCYVSYGIQSATPGDFQGQTQSGSSGDTCTIGASIRPGDWITVVWSGGDPGVRATARISGTVTPPGVQ